MENSYCPKIVDVADAAVAVAANGVFAASASSAGGGDAAADGDDPRPIAGFAVDEMEDDAEEDYYLQRCRSSSEAEDLDPLHCDVAATVAAVTAVAVAVAGVGNWVQGSD